MIPRPGELGYDTWPKDAHKYMGGVDVWGEITVDEKRGIAYFPVSSPKYELYGGDRPGNNLFADCLLALDARTGRYLWHFQTVHHDIWDYDPTAAPQLATVKRDGKTVDVVALASKNGFLYVFDRVMGKPLWPIEERPVPKSEVPGEWTSPTQPFPTMPPPFARQSFTEKDLYFGFMTQRDRLCGIEGLPVDFENGEGGGIDSIEFGRHHPGPHSTGRWARTRGIWSGGRPSNGVAIRAHDL